MQSASLADILPFLGGAVMALTARYIVRGIQYCQIMNKDPKTYNCNSTERNEGYVHHSKGLLYLDNDYKRTVWKHTNQGVLLGYNHNQPVRDMGLHTLYGPYSNDFGKPGYYKISFYIRAKGFGESTDKKIIIRLDVSESKQEILSSGASFTRAIPLGHKDICSYELGSSVSYQEFEVICYSSGSGFYEYRANVFDQHLNPDQEILFDRIEIRPYMSIWDVFL